MKNLLVVLVFLSLAVNALTQGINNEQKILFGKYDYLSGIDLTLIVEQHIIDSTTTLTILREGESVLLKMYKTEIDWKDSSFRTQLLDMKHTEVCKLLKVSFFKGMETIYALKSKKIGGKEGYVLDSLIGNRFTTSKEITFEAPNSGSYNYPRFVQLKGDFLSIVSAKTSMSGIIEEIRLVGYNFKTRNQSALSYFKLTNDGTDRSFGDMSIKDLKDKIYINLRVTRETAEEEKICILFFDGQELRKISVPKIESDYYVSSSLVCKVQDKIILYLLKRNEAECKTSSYRLDEENLAFVPLVEKSLEKSQILKEVFKEPKEEYYTNVFLKRSIHSIVYQTGDECYVVSLCRGLSGEGAPMYGDFIISAMDGSGIKWNQFVRSWYQEFRSSVSISHDVVDLKITTKEPEGGIDEEGNFREKIEGTYLGKERVRSIEILMNMSTGEFRRKLK